MGKFAKALEIIGVTPKDRQEDNNDYFDDEEEQQDIRPRSSGRRETISDSFDERPKNSRYAEADRFEKSTATDDDDSYEVRRKRARLSTVAGGATHKTLVIHAPATYIESQSLVLQLRQNKQVIIKLDGLEKDVAQRILDFMSGAAFALECQVVKIAKGIYLFASTDTKIENPEPEQEASSGEFYSVDDEMHRR